MLWLLGIILSPNNNFKPKYQIDERMQEVWRQEKRKAYNKSFLLSALLLLFLHNVYSKRRLLYLCTAEAEQVVTKDSSKNRSSAFPRTWVAGLFSPLSHFSAGLTAQHLELWSFQPLPRSPFLLRRRRILWSNTKIWYMLVPQLLGNGDTVFICFIARVHAEQMVFKKLCYAWIHTVRFKTIIMKH